MTSPSLFAFGIGSVATIALVGGVTLVACEGPQGPPGETVIADGGTAGLPGSPGGPGTPGPSGLATIDGGLTTSCMMPCHGFKGVVEQWKTSTHYFGAIANTEEVPTWTGPAACGNCHSGDGLEQRLAGNVNVAAGSTPPTGLASGELNYTKAAGGVTEVTYAGSSKVAIIGCLTCHDISAANDPHITGANYTPGTFKMRVKTGPDDQMLIEKSPTVGAVTGTPAGKWGVSNTCIACHKSRKDVTQYITSPTTPITSRYWGPHEAPQSDIFSGLGGYHYAGKTFTNSTHQSLTGCSSCHMVKVATNGNIPDHSMRPTITTCAGAGCHANVTSFDVAGGQGVVKAALGELQGLLNGLNLLTRSSGAPYAPLAGAELTDQRYNLDGTMPGNTITDLQAGALYNYLLIARGSGWGVHNPVYTKELLFDSISQLKGAPPAAIPTRP